MATVPIKKKVKVKIILLSGKTRCLSSVHNNTNSNVGGRGKTSSLSVFGNKNCSTDNYSGDDGQRDLLPLKHYKLVLCLLSSFGIKYGDNNNNKEDEGQGDDADNQEEPAPELLDLAFELSDFDELFTRTTTRC